MESPLQMDNLATFFFCHIRGIRPKLPENRSKIKNKTTKKNAQKEKLETRTTLTTSCALNDSSLTGWAVGESN